MTTATSSLAGKSVLLAGASGGIGSALAAELSKRKAILTMAARDETRLNALRVEGACVAVDLRSPEGCARAVQAAIAHAGCIDVVINAVGVVAFGPIDELSPDVMEELFLTNTFVPIMLATASLKHLEQHGAIVNISGVIAESNMAGMAAYGASKSAVRAFDQALSREARRRKVRVIDARPPHTETGLAERPIAGISPRMPVGLSPETVATVICDALESGTTDLPSSAFSAIAP